MSVREQKYTYSLEGTVTCLSESVIRHEATRSVMCVEGTDDTREEFSIAHGGVFAADSRPGLAGTDAQRRNVSIRIALSDRLCSSFCLLSVRNFWLLCCKHLILFL